MAALLTVNAGSTDKVQRYISNCNSMGINVMPPNINTSGVDFTPKDNSIFLVFRQSKIWVMVQLEKLLPLEMKMANLLH